MKKITLLILLILISFLTACTAGKPVTHIKVNMTDFAYNPNQFMVPAGESITVEIVNNGAVVHNFIIMNAGVQIGQDFDETDEVNEYWKIELAPGQSTSTSFTAPAQPGEYKIVCSTAGHYIAGMIGKLVVVAPAE